MVVLGRPLSVLNCILLAVSWSITTSAYSEIPYSISRVTATLALQQTSIRSEHVDVSIESRREMQQEVIDAQWNSDMIASPETATAYGDNRYDDRLTDYSLDESKRQNRVDHNFRDLLAAISTDGFVSQDVVSHQLLLQVLDQRIADYDLRIYEMPMSQMQGIQNDLADLPESVPLKSVQDYANYLARLHQIPKAIDDTIAVLRQGLRDGLVPPHVLLVQIPAQCDGTIKDNPFVEPLNHFPSNFSKEQIQSFSIKIRAAARDGVLPAYRRLSAFVKNEYAPHGTETIGMSALPTGAELYRNAIRKQTTTDMSPEEIHELGLREVKRLRETLDALSKAAGYTDFITYRTALNSDQKYKPASAEAIVADFRRYVDQMRPRLPTLFKTIPSNPIVVEAVPASEPGNGTHYVAGPPDDSRPARLVVATANFAQRTLLSDETLSYHEGIPGHHLQISIQQHLSGLPKFRQHLIYAAYAEGWAVYSEGLGKEIGFFQDPASDFGRLSTELLRAVRLVSDTGIHAQGWTRNQAITYFRENTAADEPTIQGEVDREIAWPAQGLSYKIGQLQILKLRARAEAQLGSRFDIREFHDAVLSDGNVPLGVLSAHIDEWIQQSMNPRIAPKAASSVIRPSQQSPFKG